MLKQFLAHYKFIYKNNNMEGNKIEIKAKDLFIEDIEEKKPEIKFDWFEKISYVSLFAAVFLLPLFFIPSQFVIFEFSKILIIVLGVLMSLIFWSLSGIKKGKLEFPATLLSSSALFAIFIYFLSALFSGNKINSLIGQGFELGTFGLVFVGFALMLLTSSIFRTKDKIFYSYMALFVSSLVVFLFQTMRLFLGADFLSLGIFKDLASNFVGKWNDLGIYFGLVVLLSVATTHSIKLNKLMKFSLYFMSIVSLFFISLINFQVIWFTIGSFALVFFIYSIFSRRKSGAVIAENYPSGRKKIPYFILFIFIISAVFIVDGFRSNRIIGNSIAGYFKISQIEVRPSFQGTSEVLKASFKENPVLGLGPNNFSNSWLLFKPDGINNTIFWNFDFSYGFSLILTFITATGILGMISWILFFGLFLYAGFKYVFAKISDPFSRYLTVSSFLASLYLWVFSVLYVPSGAIFFLSFFFTGLFISSLVNGNLIAVKNFDYQGNPRRTFISAPILILVIICSITGSYIYLQRFISNVYFQKSLNSLNVLGNLDDAERYATSALSFAKIDSYYRLLSDIYLARLSSLSMQKDIPKETFSSQFQSIFQSALKNAKAAIVYDNANYQNYLSAGRVYETVLPAEGAYGQALENCNKALILNPKSPAVNFILARLEFSNKNNAKAIEYIVKSIQLKNNYTDALFLLAQIEIAEGNIKNAIKLVEAGSALASDNPAVFFQLGVLKYSDKEKDYKGAAEAFEKAATLDPSYSNARYFLGLSYYNLGRTNDAIKQFESVQSLNPDNKEVELILNNLRGGKAPFANVKPPIDNNPEKRKTLPIKEGAPKAIKKK
ncbi:MAG: tetratricopeptide repeat protein [Patescibacteria group bacterium]|nr:tetratricopeptide repeat protein [Patescibacteria group bacterium]